MKMHVKYLMLVAAAGALTAATFTETMAASQKRHSHAGVTSGTTGSGARSEPRSAPVYTRPAPATQGFGAGGAPQQAPGSRVPEGNEGN